MVYGGGMEGVKAYAAKLRAELCDAMEMTGCASLSDIDWTKVCYE
jgi:isopentenyl diphosphate isomerase/L-lactate dehydrogenase-like FMN-dependent dehydrogenase